MIVFIIKNNNHNIDNLINGIQKYYSTEIPLMENWTSEQHIKFEYVLRGCKEILFENKYAKYQYISNYFENKNAEDCLIYFDYVKNKLSNIKNNNEILWIDYDQYLKNKNIINIFKKIFFIEIIDSFNLIKSNDTIYIFNNIEKIMLDDTFMEDIYNKKIIISNKIFTWWIDIKYFIDIYNNIYNKGNEMEELLLNGYIKNNILSFNLLDSSSKCFRILILDQILKIYNACELKKYKKIQKMLDKINVDFIISKEETNIPFKNLFELIMKNWLPFPHLNKLLNTLYNLEGNNLNLL